MRKDKFYDKQFNDDEEEEAQVPVVAVRGKVSVGEVDRVNTNASAEKGQSDEDVRRGDMRAERRTASTIGSGASTAHTTSRFGKNSLQNSGEAGTGDRVKVMDSSEKGFKIDGDAQRSKSLRSEAGLQGTVKVTLGSDKSAEIVNDRVVTGGISRPMATDGKGEEDSPSERRNSIQQKEDKGLCACRS